MYAKYRRNYVIWWVDSVPTIFFYIYITELIYACGTIMREIFGFDCETCRACVKSEVNDT